jgi:preprotein translocase SecE subunit
LETVVAEKQTTKKRIRKGPQTVRERARDAASAKDKKPRRLRRASGVAARPLKAVRRLGRKEYYLPLPDSRLGRFLNKRRSLVPRYFRESWQELRLVTWPGRKETWQLSLAVFIFAIVLGLAVSVVDYGLNNLFRKVLL